MHKQGAIIILSKVIANCSGNDITASQIDQGQFDLGIFSSPEGIMSLPTIYTVIVIINNNNTRICIASYLKQLP